VIASEQGGPVELAAHEGRLYWGTDASLTVSTAELATGTVRVLFAGRTAARLRVRRHADLLLARRVQHRRVRHARWRRLPVRHEPSTSCTPGRTVWLGRV
jgi:hypothetical protein